MPPFLHEVLAPGNWPTFALITARLSGLMLVAPLWSMTAMPRTVRAAVTVLLAVLLLPLSPRTGLPEEAMGLPLPVALEVLIGVAIGLTAAFLVQGVAVAGEVVSLQMGLSLGTVLAPSPELETPGVGPLKMALVLLVYTALGGHLMLLRGLADSLQALPPGAALDLVAGGLHVVGLAGTLFGGAVAAAAPVMVALLLANLALAILSRAVPQLNVMMVSLPFTIALGLIALGASLPLLGHLAGGWVGELPARVDESVSALRPASARP